MKLDINKILKKKKACKDIQKSNDIILFMC